MRKRYGSIVRSFIQSREWGSVGYIKAQGQSFKFIQKLLILTSSVYTGYPYQRLGQ